MTTKSREYLFGTTIRHSAERAADARKEANKLACVAWNNRMLGYQGPAQPSPTLGDALNAGYIYLEVRCLGCDTHRRPSIWSAYCPWPMGASIKFGLSLPGASN
jgi:hypothetical protein